MGIFIFYDESFQKQKGTLLTDTVEKLLLFNKYYFLGYRNALPTLRKSIFGS